MADYQRQNRFVGDIRVDATRLLDAVEVILSNKTEYTAVGGQTFFNQYFIDAAANPPVMNAEPGITEAEFNAALASLAALAALDLSALYKIKG